MLTPFSEYNEKTIRKLPKTQNYRFEIHSFFYACFSHFTVGSSKTRHITIRGLGLITTNVKHGKCNILTLFCMSHANIFLIEPEISANVAHEILFYFMYPIDVNVTLHTLKLAMAVEYEIVIIIAVNKVYQG